MNATRKYVWKIRVTADAPHPALRMLASTVFEMETFNPPPEIGQQFAIEVRVWNQSSKDRCVTVLVEHKLSVLEISSNSERKEWYEMLYARVVGETDRP